MREADRVKERKKIPAPNADINVTPLVDVVLVLLIIFMVITPMLDEDVIVPTAKHHKRTPKEDEEKLMLVVKRDKSLILDKDPIGREELPKALESHYQAREDKSLFLKADRSLKWGEVMKVMDLAREGSVEEVALITDDEKQE